MTQYAGNPDAVEQLVRADAVHRDVYTNQELFDLEMRHLWRNTWVFVGHDSQVPNPGDYVSVQVADQPVVMIRDKSGEVYVHYNRCAHKGAKVVSAQHGNCGSMFRCPYHGWTYRLDGSIRTIPLKKGYTDTGMADSEAGKGMIRVRHVENYRGFIFARLNDDGLSFRDYFGDSLTSIDNLVDRSPKGRLEIAGGVLRYLHNCNWKMYVENLNDAMHPMVTHESSAGTARDIWAAQGLPEDTPKPMVVEQFVPFVSNYEFFDNMGVKLYDNGHSYTGVNFSIHSSYSGIADYEDSMRAAYGEERAQAILGEVRHNTVYYPNLTIKGAIQSIRVARPIAADKTIIESWTFRLVGAPDELLKRTVMYNRLINAPTSMVGHDDLHCYRAIQEGLEVDGNEWVSLHRNYGDDERDGIAGVYNGTSEVSMRGQFKAWKKFMVASMTGGN